MDLIKRPPKFVVVGAGLSGAVFAERLASHCFTNTDEEQEKCVLVIEKRNHIAGNCYDYPDENTNILISKYGPHLFHTNDEKVWQYVNKFSKWFPYKHEVFGSRDGKLFPMPINIETVNIICNKNLNTKEDLHEYLSSVVEYPPSSSSDGRAEEKFKNAEEYCLAKFGRELYEKTIKSYTFKQWGKYPSELDSSVVERIPLRPSFERGYFNDKYQALPEGGYTSFVGKILSSNPKIDVILEVDYMKIKDDLFRKFGNDIKSIIFTGPIDVYFEHLGLPKLEYRSIKFEQERIFKPSSSSSSNKENEEQNTFFSQPNSVINYPDKKETPFTRITEYKHFYPNRKLKLKESETIIHKETSCSDGEPYYPVPNRINQELYQKYASAASSEKVGKGVIFCGRLASYKYYNMDQAILNSLELFKSEFIEKNKTNNKRLNNFSMVIARYNENLDWVIPYAEREDVTSIFIYDKNDRILEDDKTIESCLCHRFPQKIVYERLPNIGRESHTYLYHIVKNYYNLTENVIFCQGNPFDHVENFNVDSLFFNKDENNIRTCSTFNPKPENAHLSYGFRLKRWNNENIFPNEENLVFGDWLKKNVLCVDKNDYLIANSLENIISTGRFRFRWGAVFRIIDKNILSRTLEYYKKLLSLLKETSCETGHFFERSWFYIFKV